MIENKIDIPFGMSYLTNNTGYGYQWWMDENGGYSAHGALGQFLILNPK